MKKIDLHIHTVATEIEEFFEFDPDELFQYVRENNLDIIAITNHNLFDAENYNEVVNLLKPLNCSVLPGIELSAFRCHILVIGDTNDIKAFEAASKTIADADTEPDSLEEILSLFPALADYLVIPHFHKDPEISEETYELLRDYIDGLETTSLKKAMMLTKQGVSSVPVVCFADHRFGTSAIPKKTSIYAVTDSDKLAALKAAFSTSNGIKFNTEGTMQFELRPGILASENLNLVIGRRSTGKTFTLNAIENLCDNDQVHYIKQGTLVANSSEEEFYSQLRKDSQEQLDKYYAPWEVIITNLENIGTEDRLRKGVSEYINALVKFAESSTLADQYSKCPLFRGSQLDVPDTTEIINLVKATMTLLTTEKYESTVKQYLTQDSLRALLRELVSIAKQEILVSKAHTLANAVISAMKNCLTGHSTQAEYPIPILEKVTRDYEYRKRAKELLDRCWDGSCVLEDCGGISDKYTLSATRVRYKKAEEVKGAIGTTENLGGIARLDSKTYLDNIVSLKQGEHKARGLFHLALEVLDNRGAKLSGGQRTEFVFQEHLAMASKYQVVLIDEPESSFDNLFLNEHIADRIRALSKNATVFVTTHNQVLAYALKPDKVIFTSYNPESKNFDLFVAEKTEHLLVGTTQETPILNETILNLMEAGRASYEERKQYYENS